MIFEFKVKNFLSFKSEQVLSFEASSDKSYEDYYCVEIKEGIRLLKTAIIYGANASGKSNLLITLDFLRNLVLESPKDKSEKIALTPFLLDDDSRNQPTSFVLSFYLDKIKYVYSVLLDTQRIYEETLIYYPSLQPAMLYTRTYNPKSDSTEIDYGNHLKLGKSDRLIITGNTMNNCSVLAAFGKSNVASSLLNDVFRYFRFVMRDILRPNSDLSGNTIRELDKIPEMKGFILSLLGESDFNISNLEVHNDDELVYTHKTETGSYLLPERAESRGTIRYAGMATVLYHLIRENAVLSIDEIESSLHFDLLAYFIKLFLANGDKQSQLLFTTHDINLLNEDFIRRDAVWFTEKNMTGETVLERLSGMGLHKNLSPYNAYRQGKLGAKPFIGKMFID